LVGETWLPAELVASVVPVPVAPAPVAVVVVEEVVAVPLPVPVWVAPVSAVDVTPVAEPVVVRAFEREWCPVPLTLAGCIPAKPPSDWLADVLVPSGPVAA
jgi:hypothetical protein